MFEVAVATLQHRLTSAWRHRALRPALVWAAALLPFLLLAIWRLHDGPGLDADDYGQYLMHTRALAEGRAYTDIGYIYSKYKYGVGPSAEPPGLPLLLAPIFTIFGPNIMIMRWVMLGLAATFVLVAGLYFARYDDRRLGIGVTLLCALSPDITHGASQLLTDLPFAAIVWLVIYLVDKPGRFSSARLLAITVLGAAALAFRVPGVVLIAALALFAILHYRDLGWRPALPVMVWLLAALILLAFIPLEKLSAVRLHRILEWNWTQGAHSLRTYLSALAESHLRPFPWATANDLFHVVTGALMVIGLSAWVRHAHRRLATIFALAYAVMLLLLPYDQERYSWPLFPFFVFGLLNGVRVLTTSLTAATVERATMVALIFALVMVPPAVASNLSQPRREDLFDVPEVRRVVQELSVLNRRTRLRVVFYKPRSFAWTTGIPAMGAIAGRSECLISELARGRITHVVTGNLRHGVDAEQQRDLRRLELARPDLFAELFRTEHFVAYRFAVSAREAAAATSRCDR